MAYTKTTWVDDNAPAINASNLNKIEQGIEEAHIGWSSISATLTYASADSPTFVANTSIDLTSVISVGMKIKLTQTTVKYFIVTAITSTTITLYGGADYTLANATITLPYFSSMKSPFGFPLNPDKWSVIVTDTVGRSQATPSSGVWYNVGSLGITVPIGLWNVGYKANVYATNTVPGFRTAIVTLSETNNGDTLTQFKCAAYTNQENGSCSIQVGTYNILNVTSKKRLYMNASTNQPITNLSVDGAFATTVIKAVCAYL